MEGRTEWLVYEGAVTAFALVAGVAPLVAVYSHLWLGTASGSGELVVVLSDSVATERSRMETLRFAGTVATAVSVGGLVALAPGYTAFADDLRHEARTGVALGSVMGVVGSALALLGPRLAVEALGFTLLGYGVLGVVAGSAFLATTDQR
jgi:hypothetical protein